MTTRTAAPRTSTWAGIAVGVLLLGLMAAFAIVLPKTADAGEGASQLELALPDELPGGYAAADLPSSFADGELAEQAEQVAEQQAASTDYGNEVLPEVLATPAVTRSYVTNGTDAVFVQVIQAEGGALAAGTLTDPETTGGGGGTTMATVGDGVCILTYGQSQGDSVGEPVSSQCQVTRDGVTVQLQSNQVPAADLIDLADAVLEQQPGE
ncbi:MAG: hypothetical protein WBP61_05560 [Nocardioides sp.]